MSRNGSTPTLHEPSSPHLQAQKAPSTSHLQAQKELSTMDSSTLESQQEKQPTQLKPDTSADEQHIHPLASLGSGRKHLLLFIFALASFVDICNVSGVAVAVAQIGADTGLAQSQLVWIITSYSLCFSAFLLFAGRLSDLFPAQLVFEGGFLVLGVISLVTSFVTSDKYGFLILRGIGGIAGSMTIPSAFHLLVHMFPVPHEQQQKLALLGLSGAIGNVLGLVLAGVCMLANYRWFFRVIAIVCILFATIAIFLLPMTGSSYSAEHEKTPRWKRMDIVGVVLLMGSLICFILALTNGPINGWGSANFIAPMVLAFPLGFGFFFWESRIPAKSAVLPSSVWKITNIIISSLAILFPFAFWATSQLQFATYWQEVYHYSPIHVAVLILPQGIAGLVVGGSVQAIPQVITKPRFTIPFAAVLIIAANLLQIYSEGGQGKNYWKFCFPAFILGSAGAVMSYMAASINLITYCPPEMAGVAGAWTQVIAQIGGAVTLAVQAGLQSNNPADWKKSGARAYWFMIAWTAVLAIQYVIFYRKPGTQEEEHELTRERIRESNGEEALH